MNKKVTVVVLLISLCSAAIFFGIYQLERETLASSVDMHLTVSKKIGFNVDTDALWFGTVPPGGAGTKHIVISAEERGEYAIKTQGVPLSDWVSVSENGFILERGQSKNVTVQASVPFDAEAGDYDGVLEVFFRKV